MPKGSKNEAINGKVPEFLLTLKVNGEELKSSGSTLLEAINGLEVSIYKTNGVLYASRGDTTVEQLLPIRQMKRLFNEYSTLYREIARDQMAKLLAMRLGI